MLVLHGRSVTRTGNSLFTEIAGIEAPRTKTSISKTLLLFCGLNSLLYIICISLMTLIRVQIFNNDAKATQFHKFDDSVRVCRSVIS